MMSSLRSVARIPAAVLGRRALGGTAGAEGISSVRVTLPSDKPGALVDCLNTFSQLGVSMTHIETKHRLYTTRAEEHFPLFDIDYQSPTERKKEWNLLAKLSKVCTRVEPRASCEVPWFPTEASDLDRLNKTLGAEELINEEHPGFNDEGYKARRQMVAEIAQNYTHGAEIPTVEYTAEENGTWGTVYDVLTPMYDKWACDDYLENFTKFKDAGIFTRERIPQLCEIDGLLHRTSGFRLRPVVGLLTARDFLNSLAFRYFTSTQYIRHGGSPLYTPEPDVCHELLGHVPMLACNDFANFAHNIGIASLGAPDEVIVQLATLYWFTVEFGVLKLPDGRVKAYGAGILSSMGELEWACSEKPSEECRRAGSMMKYHAHLEKPTIKELDCKAAAVTPFPITTYQPLYWANASITEVRDQVLEFCDSLPRVFTPEFHANSNTISASRNVEMRSQSSTSDHQAASQESYFKSLEVMNEKTVSSVSSGVV